MWVIITYFCIIIHHLIPFVKKKIPSYTGKFSNKVDVKLKSRSQTCTHTEFKTVPLCNNKSGVSQPQSFTHNPLRTEKFELTEVCMFLSDMEGIRVANFFHRGILEREGEGDPCCWRQLTFSYLKLAQIFTCNCLGINDSPDRKSPVAFKWASVCSSSSRRSRTPDPHRVYRSTQRREIQYELICSRSRSVSQWLCAFLLTGEKNGC